MQKEMTPAHCRLLHAVAQTLKDYPLYEHQMDELVSLVESNDELSSMSHLDGKHDRDTIVKYIINHSATCSRLTDREKREAVIAEYAEYLDEDISFYKWHDGLLNKQEREFVAANPNKRYADVRTGKVSSLLDWASHLRFRAAGSHGAQAITATLKEWASDFGYRGAKKWGVETFMDAFHKDRLVETGKDYLLYVLYQEIGPLSECCEIHDNYYSWKELCAWAAIERYYGHSVHYGHGESYRSSEFDHLGDFGEYLERKLPECFNGSPKCDMGGFETCIVVNRKYKCANLPFCHCEPGKIVNWHESVPSWRDGFNKKRCKGGDCECDNFRFDKDDEACENCCPYIKELEEQFVKFCAGE
jgi:hypothetical protein